jgi:hypothetical protein
MQGNVPDLSQLRDLCAKHWNPIGVPMLNEGRAGEGDFRPLPEDEYDTYLLHVQSMLETGSAPNEIVSYLDLVEREYLMLTRPSGDKGAFVRALWSGAAN